MKEGLLLTVIATVLAAEGGRAKLDRGLLDGLRLEDRGQIFYELRVGEAGHQIVEGEVSVAKLEKSDSWVLVPAATRARPGYSVRFEIPAERISPRALFEAAREVARDEAEFREIVKEILAEALLADDDAVRSELRGLLGEDDSAGPDDGPALPTPPTAGMVRIGGGIYRIGADLGEARFFNEHPRFDSELDPFWVDREATPPDSLGPPSFDEALAYCRELGKRLPTEIEWEVAIQSPEVEPAPFLEWTDSWYQPYPGNPMAEREYGRSLKVLRGESRGRELGPHRRRFMAPGSGHPEVGFRCALDVSPDES